ncbi:hypothetical protein ABA45_02120 [Marinobacter psychrophilus]|uniref:Sel1 repeat family protein n=2 Tax=Marinobacter psychrophilus TaxID=330734 RepID=A0A0H4I573_9GAMM|nr:hypothetical protein ABA45_02120 [Marinobacter psychrophilus]
MFCVALSIGATQIAGAADFDKGLAALHSGDYATAFQEFRSLAEQGHTSAQYNLGNRYANGQGVPQDYAEAVTWYRKAAEQGDANAQLNLGYMYAKGQGVPQDYVQAHMWFNLSASQDGKDAAYNRDIAAERMTNQQISESQALARKWVAKNR